MQTWLGLIDFSMIIQQCCADQKNDWAEPCSVTLLISHEGYYYSKPSLYVEFHYIAIATILFSCTMAQAITCNSVLQCRCTPTHSQWQTSEAQALSTSHMTKRVLTSACAALCSANSLPDPFQRFAVKSLSQDRLLATSFGPEGQGLCPSKGLLFRPLFQHTASFETGLPWQPRLSIHQILAQHYRGKIKGCFLFIL